MVMWSRAYDAGRLYSPLGAVGGGLNNLARDCVMTLGEMRDWRWVEGCIVVAATLRLALNLHGLLLSVV